MPCVVPQSHLQRLRHDALGLHALLVLPARPRGLNTAAAHTSGERPRHLFLFFLATRARCARPRPAPAGARGRGAIMHVPVQPRSRSNKCLQQLQAMDGIGMQLRPHAIAGCLPGCRYICPTACNTACMCVRACVPAFLHVGGEDGLQTY